MKTEPATPVAVYARYSSDRQDARSIDDQMRRCRVYAAANGYRVSGEYSDAAITGAHALRPDMQRLLADARAKGGAPFSAVLVDDLSRLSRDLGDTWQLVFRDLAAVQVRVIDVTTNMASDGVGARLMFGALGLVNDTFLQLVRTETHRGLEGRALHGFWTGGRCYGYATVEEPNPPDPERPRKRMVIDPDQAATVVRVFRLFAEGIALKRIAATLNEERLPAPNDGGRGNKHGHGWGHTTIRAMLANERYLGRFAWNQSKWVRVPGRKSRRRVDRPETEWVTQEYADLAIVPRDLWDVVQSRFLRTNARAKGRPAGTGTRPSLVSGLLRCGTCGGSMTIVRRKVKAGVSYASLGCTAHASRGTAICANALSLSEMKASRMLIDALRDRLDKPELIERFIAVFQQRAAELRVEAPGAAEEAERRVTDCERRIANLTDALARVGWSDSIAAKLRDEEAQLARLRAERAAAVKQAPARPPERPKVIAGYLKNLFALLETDPARGREILARFLSPVVMTPEAEGPVRRYRATGAFNLSFLLTAAVAGEDRRGKVGCAGRI